MTTQEEVLLTATQTLYPWAWSGNQLVTDAANWSTYNVACRRTIVVALTGFSTTGPGKLTDAKGNEHGY